jgi:hypothetical protein
MPRTLLCSCPILTAIYEHPPGILKRDEGVAVSSVGPVDVSVTTEKTIYESTALFMVSGKLSE